VGQLNLLALDTEGPIFSKTELWRGNHYGDPRPLVCYSCAVPEETWAVKWSEDGVDEVTTELAACDMVVGANFKHDVGVLRKVGVDFSGVKVWDVQIAEFLLSRQTHKYPSLDSICEKYGIPKKLDVVKTEYWEKGIETEDVPWPILSEYAAHDAAVTLACAKKQMEEMNPKMTTLCRLMGQDLLILQEMEHNGITYDEELCKKKSLELDNEISEITKTLSNVYPGIPINFASGDQLSAFLYGGVVVEEAKEHIGFYKTGIKAGQPKYKNVVIEHPLPRLFEPVKGSELKKEGFYETNEGVLKKLKGPHKKLVDLLLRLSKLEKLNGTYYRGLPKLNAEMRWPKGKLHGQLNQTLAGTGRLSSSKPNQQNFASELQDIFISDFP